MFQIYNYFQEKDPLLISTAFATVYAILQPWIINIYNMIFHKRKVVIYEIDPLEVAFNQFGPNLGLHGILCSLNADIFVHDIQVIMTRIRDGSKHQLAWAEVGLGKFELIHSPKKEMELAAGFIIEKGKHHRYSIEFIDNEYKEKIAEIGLRVHGEWYNMLSGTCEPDIIEMAENIYQLAHNVDHLKQYLKSTNDLHTKFSESEFYHEMRKDIERLCYWDSGKYLIEMQVNIKNPNRCFKKQCYFNLSDKDSKVLRVNSERIMQFWCGHFQQDFTVINKDYG